VIKLYEFLLGEVKDTQNPDRKHREHGWHQRRFPQIHQNDIKFNEPKLNSHEILISYPLMNDSKRPMSARIVVSAKDYGDEKVEPWAHRITRLIDAQVQWIFNKDSTTFQVHDEWSVWVVATAPLVWNEAEYHRRVQRAAKYKGEIYTWTPMSHKDNRMTNLFYSGVIHKSPENTIHFPMVEVTECMYCGDHHSHGCGLYCACNSYHVFVDAPPTVAWYYNSSMFCVQTIELLKCKKLNICPSCSKPWYDHDDH
jgi:hypothetical protein